MNKTVNINLGNILFHIDEDAYNKLQRYLSAVSKSLSDDPEGKKEILADIEMRIGELLSEKIENERQVVNMFDIDSVIEVMGQPEDYIIDEDFHAAEEKREKDKKKLFRDSDDKFLGGVASGFAHYFGIDPLWMRILFIISSFITFGTALIIYVILWILVPEALTTSDKLQMKGEAVNISNIERKIKAELVEAGEKIKNADYSKATSGFQDIINTITNFCAKILKVFGKFIGGVLIFTGVVAIIAIIFSAFSIGSVEILGFGESVNSYPDFFHNSMIPTWLLTLFMLIAIAVPFLALLVLGIRILSNNTKGFGKTANMSLLGVWIISMLGLSFAGIEQISKNSFDGVSLTSLKYDAVQNDTLNIRMSGNDYYQDTKYLYRNSNTKIVDYKGMHKLYSTRINLDIRKSEDNQITVKVRSKAQGKSREIASDIASNIEYDYELIGNTLDLNAYFLSGENTKYNNQYLTVIVYVPEGQTIYLDTTTESFLYDVDNIQNVYDRNMANNHYTMTKKGLLCLDCNEDDYRNRDFNREDYDIYFNNGSTKITLQDNTLKITSKD